MPSLAQIHAETNPALSRVCKLGLIVHDLDTEDREWLLATLAKPLKDEPSIALSRTLTAAGHEVSSDVIGKHRRGVCACKGAN